MRFRKKTQNSSLATLLFTCFILILYNGSFNDTKPSPISHEKPVNLLDLYPSTINCKNTIPKVTNKTIQVMINLHNSAPVIQSILHALIQSTKYHTIRIAIQHDSTDETHDILLKFQHLFKNIVIKQGVAQNYDKTNRIEILSNIRNKVLEISDLKADVVLFLNDIVLCPNDITNLIDSHFINHAHVTCGMDYLIYNSKLYFYDVWTARTITGNLFYEIGDTWKPNDLFTIDQDLQTRILYEKNLAFPVYSCWNGIVAIEPEIFKQGVLFRKDQECIASECTTFCKDAWGIGFGRILVDPLIRVAYNERDYIAANKDNQGGRETQGSIDWKTVEKPKQVVCYPWDGLGKYVNVWKNRTLVLA